MNKKRSKMPPGWEPAGWRYFVRVKGYPKVLSFRIEDPDHEKTPKEREVAKADFAADMRAKLKIPAPPTPGTFAEDVRGKYYPAMDVDYPDARRQEMEYWIAQFSERESISIEPHEIAACRETLLREGPISKCVPWDSEHPKPKGVKTGRRILVKEPLSTGAVCKRLRALQNFFTVVYPKLLPNPVAQAGEPDLPKRAPRGLPYALLEEILAQMPDQGRADRGRLRPDESLSKLRLRVIATTSFPHKQLKAITDDDLHLDAQPRPWVRLRGRKKGKGTDDVAQPLFMAGAAALKALSDAGGLGPFSNSSLWKAFKKALAKVPHAPQQASPYSFRHAFAGEVLRTTKNFTAIQLMLGHTSERMAKIYAADMIDPVRAALVDEMETLGFGGRTK